MRPSPKPTSKSQYPVQDQDSEVHKRDRDFENSVSRRLVDQDSSLKNSKPANYFTDRHTDRHTDRQTDRQTTVIAVATLQVVSVDISIRNGK